MAEQKAYTMRGSSPIYIVTEIQPTVAFYKDKLGFTLIHQADDEEHVPFFAMLVRDGLSIMFKKIAPNVPPRSISQFAVKDTAVYDAFWHVDNPGALLDDLKSKGVKIVKELSDTSYGKKEFAFEDLNGYQFVCGD